MSSSSSKRAPEESIRDAFELARRVAENPEDQPRAVVVPFDPDTT